MYYRITVESHYIFSRHGWITLDRAFMWELLIIYIRTCTFALSVLTRFRQI